MDEIKAKLREVYVQALKLDIDPTTIGDNDLITKLSIDSITALEVLIWIEDAFDVTIDDEDLSPRMLDSLDTIGSYIRERTLAPK